LFWESSPTRLCWPRSIELAATEVETGRYLLGEEHLAGYAAAVDVEHGDGHVVLLGMRPQWRGQPFGNFRILFNAALYTGEVADAAPDTSGFWSPPAEEEEAEDSGGSD